MTLASRLCSAPRASLALVLLLAASADAMTVMDVPDPRPAHQVVDVTGTLDDTAIAAIDAAAADASLHGALMVVVVPSTGGVDPRQWATALFNRLRLDTQARNRGVLLMAAIDDRKSEIVLGDGFPAQVTAITDNIMSTVVVARFKNRDPKGAMVEGARALTTRLIVASPELLALEAARATQPVVTARDNDTNTDNPLFYLGGAGLLAMSGLGVREVLRRRPRSCKQCSVRMHRLGEAADDKHLQAGERAEESLGSVDYDIWACGSCGVVQKTRWGALYSSYARCTGCSWKTMSSRSRTITSATTSPSGLAEVNEECRHCSYRNSYTRVIPRVQQSSSSSSGSSSGGGSSSGRGSSGSW